MAWFDKHKKRSRQRVDLAREALGASVEELTARTQPNEHEWEEEESEETFRSTNNTAIIPPRLRLQSRPLPVVRVDVARRGPMQGADTSEIVQPLLGEARRLGRSTKVRLQAVHVDREQEPTTERVATIETNAPEASQIVRDERHVPVQHVAPEAPALSEARPSSLLCGSGIIEAGQEDATVSNPRISARSVVTIMLAGNPGPVVVHYISLQPCAGFTLHMSAPVTATTPFHYAIWLY